MDGRQPPQECMDAPFFRAGWGGWGCGMAEKVEVK